MEAKCPVCGNYNNVNISFDGDIFWCDKCGSEIQVYVELDMYVVEEKHNHLEEEDEDE